MYTTFFNKMKETNIRWNGLPRKALCIFLTLLGVFVVVHAFPYCWPFLFALLFSRLLEPVVRFLTNRMVKLKINRTLATLIGMLLLFGFLSVLLIFCINRLASEIVGLIDRLPFIMNWMTDEMIPQFNQWYSDVQYLIPVYMQDMVQKTVASLGASLVSAFAKVSGFLTTGAFNITTLIPSVMLSIVLTIMATYYMTVDTARISRFFRRNFPSHIIEHSLMIKTNLVKALFGQAKSQLLISLIIMVFLIISFSIFQVPYSLMFGLLIGLADALPIIGAGLFLIPMSIIYFILGNVSMGISVACMYLGVIVIRQVFEPKIVGANLGLYPLATMIAMYAGYVAFGFLGLLAGPILLSLIRVVLEADESSMKKQSKQ